jgi:hypothetical protein
MIGYHLAETFVFFEESIDLGFVSIFINAVVTVILFDAVNQTEKNVYLFFVFDFAFLRGCQVNFVHWSWFNKLCSNIIILITDSNKTIEMKTISIKSNNESIQKKLLMRLLFSIKWCLKKM